MATKTFRDAYEILQRHSETLRNQREPNIDDLLEIVTESVEAYKVCKERIDAVDRALQKALSGVPAVADAPREDNGVQSPPVPPAKGFDDMEDDIPF